MPWCKLFFEGNALVDSTFFDTTIGRLSCLPYSERNSEELVEQLRIARAKARELQEFASIKYDESEGMSDLRSASPEGISAFRADFAASGLSHAILAALGDDIPYTSSRAAALSWAAWLFDEGEKKWQEQLLSSISGGRL